MALSLIEHFEGERLRLTGLAYRMLGCPGEAEDAVQETYLRLLNNSQTVASVEGWLTRVCVRICLDRLKSAQRTREEYVGPWLPEPLICQTDVNRFELDETLSIALLATFELLSPAERATLILHDVFDYDFNEVAEIIGRTSVACRKLAQRARERVGGVRLQNSVNTSQYQRVASSFFAALEGGELAELKRHLAADVVFHADGGGKATATRRPVVGAHKVALFLSRVIPRSTQMKFQTCWFSGAPGLVIFEQGVAQTAFQVDIAGDLVAKISALRNPQKLTRFVA